MIAAMRCRGTISGIVVAVLAACGGGGGGDRALVARHKNRAPLVAPTDQLEERVRPLPVDRDVADLVDAARL